MLPDCSITKTGMQQQEKAVMGGRKQRRPLSRNEPNVNRKKKKKFKCCMFSFQSAMY
jgi:hypothetical protein